MEIGVADFGMNIWDGGLYSIEDRLVALKDIGYDGTERLEACSPSDAIQKAALYRQLGMDFSTCRGPNVQAGIEWTAGLGKKYVWLTPGENKRDTDFETFCRRSNTLVKACARWGLTAGIHNHMYQRIETQKELETFLDVVPGAQIVFDTGQLSMAGGGPVEIVKKYHHSIAVFHLRDVQLTGKIREDGVKDYHFCELGAGNNGFDNANVLKAICDCGWDGWIHVEHGIHQRDPLIDLRASREYIRNVIDM